MARILFDSAEFFLMVLLESKISLKTGDTAPDFSLMGIDDKMHSLESYVGSKGLLVIFMCNHCPYVKAKIDAIKQIHEKFKESIALVGINSNDSTKYPDDSFENMKKIADEKGMKFDYLVDEKQDVAKKYGAICTPDPFLFDQNRKLVFHGRIDNAMNPDDTATESTMQKNIEKYLAGEKIEKDFDPSIGCSIKWKLQQT
uniref:Alkyl hydroperoxide reductase/ Thiol specific antioxidant/ Mal allergen n=1 Tax=uncultured marine thaumarchaeote KM3_67_B11 TaxID=1456234 RepID=A0A075HH29_9ARCH|nr:alkyl hydroperoxide reductase/ Thiol specific antioxidant/ Mal allergen [uncultured marine thaumarchaeote KM3_67_B11]